MKKPRFEYKENAKAILDGHYEKPIIVLLVFYVINLILSSAITSAAPKYSVEIPPVMLDPGNPTLSTVLNIVQFLVGAAIAYATIRLALDIYNKKQIEPDKVILSGVKENFLRNVFLQFMRGLFIFLWTLLFIIPGFIKAYAYSMSFYLVNKEPELEAMSAITKSKEMTKGYKMDLFLLDLSYLGWYILGIFTLGILWLWVIPKHQVARVMYFEEIYASNKPRVKKETDIFE